MKAQFRGKHSISYDLFPQVASYNSVKERGVYVGQ